MKKATTIIHGNATKSRETFHVSILQIADYQYYIQCHKIIRGGAELLMRVKFQTFSSHGDKVSTCYLYKSISKSICFSDNSNDIWFFKHNRHIIYDATTRATTGNYKFI